MTLEAWDPTDQTPFWESLKRENEQRDLEERAAERTREVDNGLAETAAKATVVIVRGDHAKAA